MLNQSKTTIHRVSGDVKTVAIDLDFLENGNLDWDEKGLLFYLLTREEGWEFDFDDLYCQTLGTGREKLQGLIKKLERKGYIKKTQGRNEYGQFVHTIEIFESLELRPSIKPMIGGGRFYLVDLDSCLKVGYSVNPERRIKTYRAQYQDPKTLFIGTKSISISTEIAFHVKHNGGSEWYSVDREQELLAALTAFDLEVV